MIKCNLAILMAERGLKITDVSKGTGISRTTLTALYHNTGSGIQFETLDKLCEFLRVSPGDLLQHYYFEYKINHVQWINSKTNWIEVNALISLKNKSFDVRIKVFMNIDEYLFDDPTHPPFNITFDIYYPPVLYEELSKFPKIHLKDFEEKIVNKALELYGMDKPLNINYLDINVNIDVDSDSN